MGDPGISCNSIENAIAFELMSDAWLRIFSHTLREKDATLNQYWTLLIILKHEDFAIADTVSLLELNYTTIAECINRLEEQGALTKRVDDNDLRHSVLQITKSGQQLFNDLDRLLAQTARKALDSLLGSQRIDAMRMFYGVCSRVRKTRMMGNFVRGDSAFIITCAQTSMNFASLCLSHGITSFQGQLMLLIGQEGSADIKYLRGKLLQDASTVSRAVNKLAQRDYLTKLPGANKREARLTLTPRGLSLASSLAEQTVYLIEQLFGDDFLSEIYCQTIDALRASLAIYTSA